MCDVAGDVTAAAITATALTGGAAAGATELEAGTLTTYANYINNPLEELYYTSKVVGQSGGSDMHGFPEAVEAFGNYADAYAITEGDGIERMMYKIGGWYLDHEGYFEFIIEPNGSCNHRFFRPCGF